jgi:AraC family transcriptional regulator
MEYRIVQREAFNVIGKIVRVSTKNDEHHQTISELWAQWNEDGTCEKINAVDPNQNLLGISMDFDESIEEFSYMVAIENVRQETKEGFDCREIPVANWAVFTAIGPMPDAIVNVLTKVYQEWFPESGFKQADGPVIEVYFPGNPNALDYTSEVWIPVIRHT